MGYGAILWFDRGERLSREAVSTVARTVSEHLVEMLKGLGRRRPSRQRLSERVREALEKSDLVRAPESRGSQVDDAPETE
jgi:hypothetical protein